MDESLDQLLALAEDTEEEDRVAEVDLTDVPLQAASPEKGVAPPEVSQISANKGGSSLATGASGAPVKAISTLQRSSWDRAEPGSDDTTEVSWRDVSIRDGYVARHGLEFALCNCRIWKPRSIYGELLLTGVVATCLSRSIGAIFPRDHLPQPSGTARVLSGYISDAVKSWKPRVSQGPSVSLTALGARLPHRLTSRA